MVELCVETVVWKSGWTSGSRVHTTVYIVFPDCNQISSHSCITLVKMGGVENPSVHKTQLILQRIQLREEGDVQMGR